MTVTSIALVTTRARSEPKKKSGDAFVSLYIDLDKLHDQKALLLSLAGMLKRSHAHLLEGVVQMIEEIQEQVEEDRFISRPCTPQPSSSARPS